MTAILPDRPAPAAPPPVAVGAPVERPCRCGHGADVHEHYRAGTDCSGCDCRRFRSAARLRRRR